MNLPDDLDNMTVKQLAKIVGVDLTDPAIANFALLIARRAADAADMYPSRERFPGDYVMESLGYACADRFSKK